MGYRVQLIAIYGKERQAIHHDYGVMSNGHREYIPECPVVGAPLPSGAYALYINDPDRIEPDERIFARLSKDASLIACYANETVMRSHACAWTNGIERWTVLHDANLAFNHLETNGDIPPEFLPIRDRLIAKEPCKINSAV